MSNDIFSCEEHTGDVNDIKRACKQVMNKAVSKRIISKQEACVLLAELPLVVCTETIESVSISDSKTISLSDENKSSRSTKTFIDQYKKRPSSFDRYSLHRYFHALKNGSGESRFIMPNFVGINGSPKYPVTEDYARHTLIVHKPWRQYPKKTTWINEFNAFVNSDECPHSARIAYERVMRRYYDKMTNYEPKASTGDHSHNSISAEDEEVMALHGQKQHDDDFDEDSGMFKSMCKGEDFEWSKPPKVSPYFVHMKMTKPYF